ncbi:MAG: hypothetical protein SWK76_13750 [Actinomycetota bacterium]|nr:hypothetical protein [Actinomycetota bacterium]
MLQIVGLSVLALPIVLAVVNTRKKKPPISLSPVVSAAAAVVFSVLSPAKPPAYAMVLAIVFGLAAGIGLSLAAKFKVAGK